MRTGSGIASLAVLLVMASAAVAGGAEGGKRDFGLFGDKTAEEEFLPVDEAFRPLLTAKDANTVELSIAVAPGYYLYKDKISVATESGRVQLGKLALPPGEMKSDPWFGDLEVYHRDVLATLPLARATPDSLELELEVGYQGCADGGICY
ncbi:MAG TPA: protein-disulfide reductase DsbD N-terminal domain-containing protein, partial [Woeseiaceae bacterium]|nr:protein-disulfide reductase DsbD N-terminal domain-containing protein [Woeseiaceae bacterium]